MRRRQRFSREIEVLYEDDALVAVNKPPGLPAVPIAASSAASALSVMVEAMRMARQRAFVVHRIDRFTSGILLFAKTEADRDALVRQFLAHTPVREYLAVVRGRPAPNGSLVHYLKKGGMFQKLTSEKDPNAARAELHYVTERELRGASLVRVTLVTGLQNQIRVQFTAAGHPVIGDRKYHAAEAEETRITRVALHAARLQFQHPRTGKTVEVTSALPSDMRSLIDGLRAPTKKMHPHGK